MSKTSAREGFLVFLLVVAIGIAAWKWYDASITDLDEMFGKAETHRMSIVPDPANTANVKVVSSTGGGNTLDARLGDTVVWKNDSTQTVNIEFDQSKVLFGDMYSISLTPNQEAVLTISAEAEFGNPGFVHRVHVTQSTDMPGSNIIVCPPLPLPCN